MRGTPTCGPNSPREIGLGEVMPREIQPEIASKSNVRQTIERGMTCGVRVRCRILHRRALDIGTLAGLPRGWHNSALPRRRPAAMTSRDYSLDSFWMQFTANRSFKKLPRVLVGARDMHFVDEDARKI